MENLLDVPAAADLLHISPFTLKEWRRRGYGPQPIYLSPGGRRGVRYRLGDIEAFLDERQRQNGKDARG